MRWYRRLRRAPAGKSVLPPSACAGEHCRNPARRFGDSGVPSRTRLWLHSIQPKQKKLRGICGVPAKRASFRGLRGFRLLPWGARCKHTRLCGRPREWSGPPVGRRRLETER